jgi:hypothetical protein
VALEVEHVAGLGAAEGIDGLVVLILFAAN